MEDKSLLSVAGLWSCPYHTVGIFSVDTAMYKRFALSKAVYV